MMIADMVTGLVVDDTMYIMTSLKKAVNEGKTSYEGAIEAFYESGPALITTSLVLACGFAAICFTDFIPNRHFGILMSLTVLCGIIGDFVFLPALLRAYENFQLKFSNNRKSSAHAEGF